MTLIVPLGAVADSLVLCGDAYRCIGSGGRFLCRGGAIGISNVEKQPGVRRSTTNGRHCLIRTQLACKHVGLTFASSDGLDAVFGLTLAFWSGGMFGDEKTVAIFQRNACGGVVEHIKKIVPLRRYGAWLLAMHGCACNRDLADGGMGKPCVAGCVQRCWLP